MECQQHCMWVGGEWSYKYMYTRKAKKKDFCSSSYVILNLAGGYLICLLAMNLIQYAMKFIIYS